MQRIRDKLKAVIGRDNRPSVQEKAYFHYPSAYGSALTVH
jgi:hypothetical protein